MTNTMKITINGKTEIVKRAAQPLIPIKMTRPASKYAQVYKPAKAAMLKRNRKGTNQYQIKHRNDWQKTMIVSFLFLFVFVMLVHGGKVWLESSSTVNLKVRAQEATESAKLISPLPDNPIASPSATPIATESAKMKHFKDARVEKVWDYLFSNGSPLTDYAEIIVEQADSHDIPWTLIVAIAGKESSFGKRIQPGSFNAWGIMDWKTVDGKKVRFIRQFGSWEEGIKYASNMISDNYRVNMNRAIQEKYCPSFECSANWTNNVTQFQQEINDND